MSDPECSQTILRWTLALSLFAGSCASSQAADQGSPLAEGTWGGPHVELAVGRRGATIELDCAHGAIAEPILVGSDGRFKASGTYVREHGGPVREEEEREGEPAVYTGSVAGETLTLAIALAGGSEKVGTFHLVRGRSGRITKCL
ncbi:MAG TPA: hypothetical protein VE078_04960 [Thermoanaerobaculia bacterium]|nr:hypothetical protein [Thermoanaerobaculia bacterium]